LGTEGSTCSAHQPPRWPVVRFPLGVCRRAHPWSASSAHPRPGAGPRRYDYDRPPGGPRACGSWRWRCRKSAEGRHVPSLHVQDARSGPRTQTRPTRNSPPGGLDAPSITKPPPASICTEVGILRLLVVPESQAAEPKASRSTSKSAQTQENRGDTTKLNCASGEFGSAPKFCLTNACTSG
jgi:hypothetical protein